MDLCISYRSCLDVSFNFFMFKLFTEVHFVAVRIFHIRRITQQVVSSIQQLYTRLFLFWYLNFQLHVSLHYVSLQFLTENQVTETEIRH